MVQRIEPGAINWMTAGRGIVHSERTPDDLRGVPRRSHGLQLWTAVPPAHEEAEPRFAHTPAEAIPAIELAPGSMPVLSAAQPCRLALVGGAPLGHRFMVWNFVSSRKECIQQAEGDWRAQRFDKVPGETEFIPLPPPRG